METPLKAIHGEHGPVAAQPRETDSPPSPIRGAAHASGLHERGADMTAPRHSELRSMARKLRVLEDLRPRLRDITSRAYRPWWSSELHHREQAARPCSAIKHRRPRASLSEERGHLYGEQDELDHRRSWASMARCSSNSQRARNNGSGSDTRSGTSMQRRLRALRRRGNPSTPSSSWRVIWN